MFKRIVATAFVGLLAVFGTGCMGTATPVLGILITDVKWDGHAEGRIGTKEGRACAQSILTLVAQGDASIATAARNGGITNVTSVDHETKWTLIFGEYCTIVRGS